MKQREILPFASQAETDKPVVAVLLACGVTNCFPEFGNIKYKALLPLDGRPIVDFVAEALCKSQVEKVFIVHESDEDIKKVITSHEKIIFIECKRPDPAMIDSLMCGLERLFEYYGENGLNQKQIMFVPCDIPLSQAQDFNALIGQAQNNNADYCATFVSKSLLNENDMGRRFRKIHLNELGGDYSIQPINFIRSRNFKIPELIGSFNRTAPHDNRGSSSRKILKIIEDARKNRHSVIGWVRFAYGIAGKGGMALSLQLVFGLLGNSITESKFEQAVYRTLNVKVAVIESQSTNFSLDIDKPSDLTYVSGLAASKAENNSGA
ncbi:MAG: NTP transferase domain-containing protein [Dehalococcoidales bacterium]